MPLTFAGVREEVSIVEFDNSIERLNGRRLLLNDVVIVDAKYIIYDEDRIVKVYDSNDREIAGLIVPKYQVVERREYSFGDIYLTAYHRDDYFKSA